MKELKWKNGDSQIFFAISGKRYAQFRKFDLPGGKKLLVGWKVQKGKAYLSMVVIGQDIPDEEKFLTKKEIPAEGRASWLGIKFNVEKHPSLGRAYRLRGDALLISPDGVVVGELEFCETVP